MYPCFYGDEGRFGPRFVFMRSIQRMGFSFHAPHRNVTGCAACGPHRTGRLFTGREYNALTPVSPGHPLRLPVYARVTPTPSTSAQAAAERRAKSASAGLNILGVLLMCGVCAAIGSLTLG